MTTKWVQCALYMLAEKAGNAAFDPGTIDGIAGVKTTAAVRAFQKEFTGLTVDGIAGEQTCQAMIHALAYGLPDAEDDGSGSSADYAADYDDSPDRLWSYFMGEIGNAYGVAGLLGNLNAESNLVAANLQDYFEKRLGMTDKEYTDAVDSGRYTSFAADGAGYGLAQWTDSTRKAALLAYARQKGASIGSKQMQAEYLMTELHGRFSSVLATLESAGSVLDASNAVLMRFECPADQSAGVQSTRAGYGATYYTKFANAEKQATGQKAVDSGAEQYLQADGYYHIPRGVEVQLSPHLWASEIHCQGTGCCTESKISKRIIDLFEEIRDDMGVPLEIGSAGGSGYRCPTHNAAVDGAAGSLHLNSDAVDIHYSNPSELMACVQRHLTDGEYGLYSWGCHVGVWDRGYVNRFQ